MSPRPRTLDDTEILAGTARVLARVGPARLTLAAVAAEVALAPATLVQRFGSRRGLLLGFAAQAASTVTRTFATARAAGRPSLETLIDALTEMTRTIDTPEALGNSLAFLQLDVSAPDFHRHARDHARAMRAEIQASLEAAVAGGEIPPCDTARLARAVQATYNGALVTWAIDGEGPLARWLRAEVEWLLGHRGLPDAYPMR